VSPKYSADPSHASEWRSDQRHVFATWVSSPFVGHRHRHETVEHRLVVEYTHEVGVDVLHEVRSSDTGKIADEWELAELVEVREYGARHERREVARWLS